VLYINHRHRAWELPGGKQKGDETSRETVIREVREETGYKPLATEPLGTIVFFGPTTSTLTKNVWGSRKYASSGTREDLVTEVAWASSPPAPLSFGKHETATLLFVNTFLDEKP